MAAAPRRIVPMIHPASPGVIAPAAHLTSHGGRVLGAVQVVPLFWGAFWAGGDGAQLVTLLEGFFDLILASPFMDLLAEYSTPATAIGHGGRLPSVLVPGGEPGDPAGAGRRVSDGQVQQALRGFLADGTAPAPAADALYFVYLPPGCVSALGAAQSCQGPGGFCGYHGDVGGSVFYAVQPFLTCLGCSFGTVLDSLTKVGSHELAEAVTDPAGDGWFDDGSGDEVGDICNTSTAHLGGFLVQSQWSNARAGCVIAP